MLDLDGKLRLHDQCKIAVARIGAEREPVVVVDNFLENPWALVDYAAGHSAFSGVLDAFYPGARAPIPAIYGFALRAFLGGAIAEAFGLGNSIISGELSHFSLVTTPPDKLKLVQRMPHFDHQSQATTLPHYLCSPDHGGTSLPPSAHTPSSSMRPAKTAMPTLLLRISPTWDAARQIHLRRRSHVERTLSLRPHSIRSSSIAASICTAPTSGLLLHSTATREAV
jgi:hypothetical protein